MTRVYLFLILFFVAGLSVAAGEETEVVEATPAEVTSVGVTSAEIQAMEQRLVTVFDPAARLFFQANIYRAKGELEQALKSLAKLTALHAHNKEWITRSELLTAKLYLDMGMTDAADVTARQVEFLNEGTEAAETARLFREKIKQVKEQSEESE